jgi:hypothetical protein
MSKLPATRSVVGALLAVALVGCTVGIRGAKTATSAEPVAQSGGSSAAPTEPTRSATRAVTLADARHCPVTIGHPVPQTMPWRHDLAGFNSAYGNGSLWVGGLWQHGIVIMTRDNIDSQGRLEIRLVSTHQRIPADYRPAAGRACPASQRDDLGLRADGLQRVRRDLPHRRLLADHRASRPGLPHL